MPAPDITVQYQDEPEDLKPSTAPYPAQSTGQSDGVPLHHTTAKSNGADVGTREDVQRNLQEMFAKASEDVRVRAARLEERVFRPLGEWATTFSRRRPIAATYLAVFVVLSIFPFLTFLAFAIISTLLTTLANIFITILFLSFLFTVGSLILLAVLFCTALTAVFLTIGVVGTVAVYRLGFAVSQKVLKS